MKKFAFISKLLIFMPILFFTACGKIEPFENLTEDIGSNKIKDTILQLSEMKSDTVIWNDNGIYRRVTFGESNDPIEEDEQEANKATCSPSFSGTDRKAAKISLSAASESTNYTFNAFRNTLQTDTFMRSLAISTNSSSGRVSQENRNVYITTSYLYAIKNESDGDLHMIIGDLSKVALTNCEASGLPSTAAASYSKIKAVKDAIVARFGTDFCGKSSYTIFDPPILVDILRGSLFFDVDHAAGVVGPTGYRPSTSWEIHPISQIKF